jgi:hypothetical protein
MAARDTGMAEAGIETTQTQSAIRENLTETPTPSGR